MWNSLNFTDEYVDNRVNESEFVSAYSRSIYEIATSETGIPERDNMGEEAFMKISNSFIAMSSTHHESSYVHKESVTMEASALKDLLGAILTISAEAEGKSYTESMKEYEKRQ